LPIKSSKDCDVDFSTKKGKDRLNTAVNQLVTILFSELNRQQQLLEIEDKLRAEGISEDIINKCFNQSKQNLPSSEI